MLRKTNRKAKKRVFTLIFLFVFFISSSQVLIFSSLISASVEERDISVEWGDNVFQNLPYTYYGTFYENTDPTDAWDTSKIEFTYIPDSTINDEYTITQDFTNSESKFASGEQNLTITDGSYSDFDNIQSNNDNYASFNYTGIGLYNATYSFTEELEGTSGDNIEFIGATDYATCEIVGELDGHNKVLKTVSDANSQVAYTDYFSVQTTGTIEFWVHFLENNKKHEINFMETGTNRFGLLFYNTGAVYYYNGGWVLTGETYLADVWYHVKVDFDVADDWHLWIDGVSIDAGVGYGFNGVPNDIDRFRLYASSDNGETTYYDAFDYSWSPSYEEGRNREDLSVLGNFPATYSFDDQPVWTSGLDVDWIDSIGGSANGEIISEIDGHRKVLNFTAGSIYSWLRNGFSQTEGVIEVWLYPTSISDNIQLRFDSDVGEAFYIMFGKTTGNIQFYNLAYTLLDTFTADSWYHIKLDFNCISDIVDVYINGILKLRAGEFRFDASNMIKFYILSQIDGYSGYVDAIGYSWDSEYNLGDNLNDNYYLGYENFESYNMTNDAKAELEANGWVVTKGSAYNNVSISGEFNSHKKILNITDYHATLNTQSEYLFSDKTSGSIEWYAKVAQTNTNFYMTVSDGLYNIGVRLYFASDGNIYYYDSSGHIIQAYLANTWYRFKVSFSISSNGFDLWINDVLKSSGDYGYGFGGSPIAMDRIIYQTYQNPSINYVDAVSFNWEDTNTYFKGSYNQHCNVEALIDFEVVIPFEYYERFILQVSMDSRYYTNVHTNITWSFYNFTSDSWIEINNYSAITETLREFDDSDVSVGLTGLFDSSGNMKFRYYGYNCSAFYLEIDELTSNIYFGTVFSYEKTLKLLGTWKYRFKLNLTLYNEHITDWIYFNVVEQPANFEGISESRYSTRWVLTSTETTGELTEVYYDDLTSGYWDLADATDRNFYGYYDIDQDSFVNNKHLDPDERDTNYGTATNLQIYISVYGGGWDYYKRVFLSYDTINELYFDSNSTWNPNTQLYIYAYQMHRCSVYPLVYLYNTTSFGEYTITWNNQPATVGGVIDTHDTAVGDMYFDLGTTSTEGQYLNLKQNEASAWAYCTYRSREYESHNPKILVSYVKNYHNTSGEGYAYFQTNTTEILGLISPKLSSNTSLSKGDIFTVDLQTTSDNALIKLYSGAVLQQTINLLTANTETSRQEVEVIVSEDVSFDQIKITSELEDTEYFKLYDIKAEHWVFESEEDQKIMYVEPFGQNELILNLGNNSLKIYENNILRTDTYITMTYDLTTHIFESPIPETVFVSFYDSNNDYLDFNKFTIYVNYTLYEENFVNQRLTNREFYVDEDSTIYFNIYDSFDVNIYYASRLAKTFIDITLNVYTLKIKNEALDDSSYTLTKGSVSKTGILFPDEIDEYKIASGSYTFAYIKGSDPEESIGFTLSGDKLLKINRSQMCFLSYTNQRGEYLNFNQFKTYWNGTLLYENVFYEDIGNNVSIEIKDHYNISVKNHSFVVSSGDNYIPVILTMYSLKVFNQQEVFNHINITRDPNYYESGYSWSEWVAPTEIIEFTLFAGYYKINLTDNENSGSSYYSYTLNGDDILLISSGNIISNVIINIANINATLGNQITNVEINITNQNSQINNSIINVEINLGNINSTLGNMLVNLDLDITNIANNISNLYTFTNNSFINLDNNMNNSFIYMENNIISINQSISNLVIGVSNNLLLVNGTISTLITQVDTNLLLMNVSINTALFDLDTTIMEIGNNITNNYILLNNSITLANNNINDSRIAIINNLALINNTMSNLISQVYSSVYMINNSIYTAVVDVGTSLSLINNTISGNLSIVLEQNDFLTELYRTTMFSELLNWTNIGYNSSLIDSQIDVWEFINNYKNQSIEVHLRYQDIIDNLTITAQNSIPQYLPKYDTEYNLWSVEDQEYLDEWQPLPENRTVPFGFYEEMIPDIPDFNAPNTVLMIVLILMACGSAIALVGYMAYRYRKKSENYRRSYADKITLEAQTIKNFSQGKRIK